MADLTCNWDRRERSLTGLNKITGYPFSPKLWRFTVAILPVDTYADCFLHHMSRKHALLDLQNVPIYLKLPSIDPTLIVPSYD